VGAFAVGIVPVDSHCWPSGEIFVDVCLTARSGDILADVVGGEGVGPSDVSGMGVVELVFFVPQETVRDEDGELVCGVGIGA
jgi:hypothetical protein